MRSSMTKKLMALLLAIIFVVTFAAVPVSAYVEPYVPETDDTGISEDIGDDEDITENLDDEEEGRVPSGDTPEYNEDDVPPTGAFSDVSTGAFYYDAVNWAVGKNITSGTGGGKFSPGAACTRAQAVTFLWRAAGEPEPVGDIAFTDVKSDAYYAKAVRWAVGKGITSGTGGGKFSPNAPCSRAQIVTFLYRDAGSPSAADENAFTDVASDKYYAKAVNWAVKKGVTSGTGNGKFSPDATCNRGQIVTFLYRYAG